MARRVPTEPQRTQIKIAQLVPYILQSLFYGQTSPEEDERLLADLRSTGQRDPIIVVPVKGKPGQFVILDGHRRVEAAGALGWGDLDAIVRWDLAEADDAMIETGFLSFNLNRRQLHPLDKARIVLRKFEIEKGRPRGGLKYSDEIEARDRVGEAINMSGRNLSRYFRLLLTPVEVQNAVRDSLLPLVDGEKVEGLSKGKQAEIAARIANGERPKVVVGEYIQPKDRRHRKASDAFTSFVKSLEQALDDLGDRPDKIFCSTLKKNTPLLKRARRLISKLIDGGNKKPGDINDLLKRVDLIDAPRERRPGVRRL